MLLKITFLINLFFNILIAFSLINFAPPLATITGSKIIFLTLILFNDLITEFITLKNAAFQF